MLARLPIGLAPLRVLRLSSPLAITSLYGNTYTLSVLSIYIVVPGRGLEPPRITPLAPKASASANFATPACVITIYIRD